MEAMEHSSKFFNPSVDLSSFYCVLCHQNVVNVMVMSDVVRCVSYFIPDFRIKNFVGSSIPLFCPSIVLINFHWKSSGGICL